MIKPWHSKNFLHMMTWSSVRDYPPKTKKAWRFGNFMEMEETHSDHMEMPFEDPTLPLPPPPDIPQTDEEPDPCAGDRSLWVTASPSSVDCDVGVDFNLIFSPDFKCLELQQAFFDEDGPKLVDQLGNDLSIPTNAENITGNLKLERGCDDASSITLWASDCLCGGVASVDIWLSNCGADCDAVNITGSPTIWPDTTEQYTINNLPEGDSGTWSSSGTGITINQSGLMTAHSNACGMAKAMFISDCCGTISFDVKVNAGYWQLITEGRGDCEECTDFDANPRPTNCTAIAGEYKYTVGIWGCAEGGTAPCVPKGSCTGTASGIGWEVHRKYQWSCVP